MSPYCHFPRLRMVATYFTILSDRRLSLSMFFRRETVAAALLLLGVLASTLNQSVANESSPSTANQSFPGQISQSLPEHQNEFYSKSQLSNDSYSEANKPDDQSAPGFQLYPLNIDALAVLQGNRSLHAYRAQPILFGIESGALGTLVLCSVRMND